MNELPEEIIRHILSYRSLPSFRRSSHTLDRIERDLLQERINNIKNKYGNLTGIMINRDYDSLKFIIHNIDIFPMTDNELSSVYRIVGAIGWIDESKLLISIGSIANNNNIGCAAAEFGRIDILIFLFHITKEIDYMIMLAGASRGDQLHTLEYALNQARMINYPISMELLARWSSSHNSKNTVRYIVDTYPHSEKLILLGNLLSNYVLGLETLSYVIEAIETITNYQVEISILFNTSERLIGNSDNATWIECLVNHGMINYTIRGTYAYDILARQSLFYRRIHILDYMLSIGADPNLLIGDLINDETPSDITDLVYYYQKTLYKD